MVGRLRPVERADDVADVIVAGDRVDEADDLERPVPAGCGDRTTHPDVEVSRRAPGEDHLARLGRPLAGQPPESPVDDPRVEREVAEPHVGAVVALRHPVVHQALSDHEGVVGKGGAEVRELRVGDRRRGGHDPGFLGG